MNYKDALTPSQSKEMTQFLNYLLWAGSKAVEANVKPDVGNFINAWSDRRSREEWKIEQSWERRVAQI